MGSMLLRALPFWLVSVSTIGQAGNLLLNGSFEDVNSAGMPDNWAVRAWTVNAQANSKTLAGGLHGSRQFAITQEAGKGVYGCYSRAVDVSALRCRRLMLSYSYRTMGEPNAQALVVFFDQDFMRAQWETRPLTEEARPLRSSSAWVTRTWHADLIPGAKQAVVVFQVFSPGTLFLDNVVLRASPDEVALEPVDIGRVTALPSARRALVRLTNLATGRSKGKLTVTPLRNGKPQGPVSRDVTLEGGETQEVDVRYSFPASEPHELEVSLTDGAGVLALYQRFAVPGLVDATLQAPAFRGTLMTSLAVPEIIVTGRVFGVPGVLDQVSLRARLMGTGAEAEEGKGITRSGDGSFRLALPSEGLLIGEHEVRIEARVRGRVVASTTLPIRRTRPRDHEVSYDADHRLWVRGQPVFPLGIYYPTGTEDLDPIQAAGFNLVVVPWARAAYVMAERAAAKGIGLLIQSANTQRDFWERAEMKYGNHPALVGWETLQRPDAKLILPDIMLALYQIISEVSPTHPVATTLRYSETMRDYARATDILIPWELPVPRIPLTRLADVVDNARLATNGAKPVWPIIQAAGNAWASDKTLDEKTDGRHPTVAEVRALAYLAIVHGADGLLYYAYSLTQNEKQRNYNIRTDAPDLWAGISVLNRQIASLTPIITDRAARITLPTSPDDPVHMAAWRQGDRTLLIAVNTSGARTITSIVVPDSLAKEADVLFEDRRCTSERAGSFVDMFEPHEVHVYAVKG